ncbi:MAG: isoleucine--tRNA ligase [Lachnospirales bacterium]
MYNKVDTNMNFVQREEEILKFWNENEIFEKSKTLRSEGEVFTFYDGPPTANGMPHIGHVITRAVKDIIPRYRTMKGYNVLRKAGWDTHGLPVELEVEKLLNIDGKQEIEKYGVEPFIEKCKESVWKYEKEWRNMSDRVAYWVDMDDPYVTYHDNYIESIWWALRQIWDKGLIYKGHKVVPYCPRCGTALSSHEVAQGYKDVKDDTVIAKFKVKNESDFYILAWTTTPWTLPSNVALTINGREQYTKVKVGSEYFLLAEALIEKVFGCECEIEKIETKVGKDWEYLEYEPLLPFGDTMGKKAHYICCDDYVTLTDGSGVVHTAPAFGEDDANVGRKYDLPFIQLVNDEGKFKEEVTPWAGVFVKDADKDIIKYLANEESLFKTERYEHSYPHCWRCDTPLIYYARKSWFIKMTAVKDSLVKNNNTVNWYPDNIRTGRFGNFLENVIDWGLSRERYWGTPLPIWECECGHRHLIGSKEELRKMSSDCPEEIELHKPFIDKVHLNCPKCNKEMTRISEVIDCWFDSGAMPFAQWHYPFENKELFDSHFPADFISEAVDQTRGWFYTLMAISTLIFDKSPYKNCIVLGHVQDKDGKKMSKSKGNSVSPWDALNTHGADAVRWYFYSNSSPWLPNRYYDETVSEGQRKFMGTFWNTYAFYVLYANIDEFNPMDYTLEYDKLHVMDKWILSKLNTLVKFVDESLEEYKLTEPSRMIMEFVDELSNWYVRRSRERFWAKGMEQDKINAYMTLYEVLVTVAKISAPFVPFMTEEIYQNLVRKIDNNSPESIHFTDFPLYNESFVNKELEENMGRVLDIVVLGRAGRNESNSKNRQPLSKMLVKGSQLPNMYVDIILEELNVKNIEFVDNSDSFTSYTFKPQLKTLGPKYGKILPKIGNYLKEGNGSNLMAELKSGSIKFDIDGTAVELFEDDVLTEEISMEGYMVQSSNNVTVILDLNLTPELIEEGFVREIISKLQTMRKEADFEIMDKIIIYIKDNDKIKSIVEKNMNVIKSEVLCNEVKYDVTNGYEKSWDINGENVIFAVER